MSGRTEGRDRTLTQIGRRIFWQRSLACSLAAPASAAKIDDQFRAWLQNDLWPEAKAKGISKKTFDAAFDGIKPNLKLPDLVKPGEKATTPQKQHQAEFGSPGAYFAEKTIGAVTAGGRAREAANARTIAAIEKRYGVPGEVLLAIWGRETGFGAAKMPYDAFEVLGTKAFMSTEGLFVPNFGRAGNRRARAGPGRRNEIILGCLGQPQFADLVPETCRRFRRRRSRRHLELDAGRAGVDRQLSRPLWLGEGARLGFRGDRPGDGLLFARRSGPGQDNFAMG